ncbi:MAG: hypothetical protein ACRD50_17515 [Candidatus Acidiferrales bacterium]
MLSKPQKTPNRSDPTLPIRLPTVPRARALVSPRAGPWITIALLTHAQHCEKVTHVLHHEQWTDMA